MDKASNKIISKPQYGIEKPPSRAMRGPNLIWQPVISTAKVSTQIGKKPQNGTKRQKSRERMMKRYKN